MRQSTSGGRQKYYLKPSSVGESVASFLERRHPAKTADNVAADLLAWGINRDTVAQMLQRRTAPGAILWLALIDAYGPEFLAAAHPARLGWLDEAARAQRKATLEARMADLKSEMERL